MSSLLPTVPIRTAVGAAGIWPVAKPALRPVTRSISPCRSRAARRTPGQSSAPRAMGVATPPAASGNAPGEADSTSQDASPSAARPGSAVSKASKRERGQNFMTACVAEKRVRGTAAGKPSA